jgi:predicted dehydrogenase
MVVESGIHGINFLEYLLGPIQRATPLSVQKEPPNSGSDGDLPPRRVSPKVSLVEFPGGIQGLLKFFPSTGKALEWYEFQGQEYSAYLQMRQPFLDEEKETLSIFQHREGSMKLLPVELDTSIQDPFLQQGFLGEYEEFLQVVLDPSRPTRSNFQNGWSSLAVAEAIEQGREYRRQPLYSIE